MTKFVKLYLENQKRLTILERFGKQMRKIRKAKKMSQGDLAEILRVHRTYISGLERGLRNPSLLTMEKIAKALSIEIKDLF